MKSPIITGTPVEECPFLSTTFDIKREDLACKSPGPPFAKVRGLWNTLLDLKKQGVTHVGYMETAISMAGWGISYFCHVIGGITPTIYYPQYKAGLILNLERHMKIWGKYGAELVPIRPQVLQVNWYQARNLLYAQYGKEHCHMLPQGMPCEYSVEAIAKEVQLLKKHYGTIVVCVGSGVQFSGIIRGLYRENLSPDVYGIFVAPKSEKIMLQKVLKLANLSYSSWFGDALTAKVHFIDERLEYLVPSKTPAPFPCNPYYDRKAWQWLTEHYTELKPPILFWNIGA